MGRRKIEIKAIKDDRNRSVTFLKRKGGLFKKAHELSVLCSVDVAVFIFGNNKKLYEYSSSDMQTLIARHQAVRPPNRPPLPSSTLANPQQHGGTNEHKGPSDFNGGNDEEDDDEADVTPPRAVDAPAEAQMMPPQFHGQQQPFSQILRHHTPSASPPVGNGGPFQGHPGHPGHPGHHGHRASLPQQSLIPRPDSRNDSRRMPPNVAPQPIAQAAHGPHHGITYMPTPPLYNPATSQPGLPPQHGGGHFAYPPHQQHSYIEDRQVSAPPTYTTQPPHAGSLPARSEPAQVQPQQHLPHHSVARISPPPPHPGPDRRPQDALPPLPMEPKTDVPERPHPPHAMDTAVKKLPQRKSHSIFTPIEENRSILSQHLASFASEPPSARGDPTSARSLSVDSPVPRPGPAPSPKLKRSSTQGSLDKPRNASMSSGPDGGFTPPSRPGSVKVGGSLAGSRSRGPRLTVQIPDEASEPGSGTGESNSPHNTTSTPTLAPQRHNSHSSVVLPPPSPSATALLSAGASGPPNPFARPPPHQTVNGDTPVSALPSRILNNELLPSPSSFYPDWNFRGSDSNTLPSPLNFATPVVGSGPSFLRDDHGGASANPTSAGGVTGGGSNQASAYPSASLKRKSPDYGPGSQTDGHAAPDEPKRVKVEL
ncbi:hypothetical protein RJ55_06979 [Drechmeria coniospora]|nr:hypothetical protein RJ55_06979 [Drechmeria coniospora]